MSTSPLPATYQRFITIEAGEGAGKSTQTKLLADALLAAGHPVDVTREPGGTSRAELLRGIILSPLHEWSSAAETLLFAAARCDHVENRIVPALKAGKFVVCDRYIDSTRAYQSATGGLSDDDLMRVHHVATKSLMPALTILLDIPEHGTEAIAARLSGRGLDADRMELKNSEFHATVRAMFRDLAAQEPERFVVINALQDIQTVHTQICAAIRKRYGVTL